MSYSKIELGVGVAALLLVALALWGWIANIAALVNSDLAVSEWGAYQIVSIIGIPIWPIGAVMGFM